MAGRCGSLSRSLISSARASASPFRSSPPLSRPLRPPPVASPRLQSRRLSFAAPSRLMGELGCTQSLLPLHCTPRLTSHLSVDVRACCELYHGT
ncbi:uncharacterized protein LOC115735981 isoform X2 [Rhodamnia argentea]|uniref:Uncharacterized protein LOC115735981 isoform X2 n=1 Tax=Rhodamnia argentea TaxID=178133 RepID=A0A8B8NLF6_9MYRT|nr:uncharacterized protein LOC115735981 isoform X2 [Rhodamnia argentea]